MTNQPQAPGDPARRRIVVGVDRSLGARIALEHAARRTGANGSLLVTHVMPPPADAISRMMSELDEQRHAAAQELVDRPAGDAGVDTEAIVVDGQPAQRLAELARERGADEIVIGSRGMGRFAAALGSVSHALLTHADVPVVVVPPAAADHPGDAHAHEQCTVVVGYDGSPPARVTPTRSSSARAASDAFAARSGACRTRSCTRRTDRRSSFRPTPHSHRGR